MPVLSSFISYRPKRKQKAPIQVSSPFPLPNYGTPLSPPHPYASPRVLDIHDGYGRTPPEIPDQPLYYNTGSTPRVQLNMDPEPLTDWFPTNFFKSEPAFTYGTQTSEASGSGLYYGGFGVSGGSGAGKDNAVPLPEARKLKRSVEIEEENDETVSADDVLADMEAMDAMDASNFVGQLASDIQFDPPQQQTWKKPTPTPIMIPNAPYNGPKVQLLRSGELSRPISQVSSPESSAISGTTIARALMANTFVLSGDTRQSRYRSGASTLTRTDSATLPRGEYAMLNSPYWLDRASMEFALSPGSASSDPIPPIPGNAELVYVPPQTQRNSAKDKPSPDLEREARAKPSPEQRTEGTSPRPTEASSSEARSMLSSYTTNSDGSVGKSTPDKIQSSRRPDVDVTSSTNSFSDGVSSPPISEPPTSARDLDNVLDYYSFADTPEPIFEGGFRLPFSPITEESSSQLSPPTPFNRPLSQISSTSKRSLPAGRFFLGTLPSSSPGGARTDRNARRDSSTKLPIGERTSISSAAAPIPSTMISRSKPSISSIPESVTNSIFSTSTHTHNSLNTNLSPPHPTIFNRLRTGAAPSPIKVVRDANNPRSYDITVTPGTSGSTDSRERMPENTDTENTSDIQQTFPETPSMFSPSFSPPPNGNGASSSPGIIQDYLQMAVPTTPLSAFLPIVGPTAPQGQGQGVAIDTGNEIQPSLAQQMLLTRAATSVHGARHSRQASLSKMMRQQGLPMPKELVKEPVRLEGRVSQSKNTIEEVAEDGDGSPGAELGAEDEIDEVKIHRSTHDGSQSEKASTQSLPASERAVTVAIFPSESAKSATKSLPSEHFVQKSLWSETGAPTSTPPGSVGQMLKTLPEERPSTPLRSSPPQPSSRSPLPNTPLLQPSTPVLGTVSLPQVTPEPPSPPVFSFSDQPFTHNSISSRASEESEAILAYDLATSGNNSVAQSRAPSRAASKRSNASFDSPKLESKVLTRNGTPSGARLPPSSTQPTQTPPQAAAELSAVSAPHQSGRPATPQSLHSTSPIMHHTATLSSANTTTPSSAASTVFPTASSLRRPGPGMVISPPHPLAVLPPAQSSPSSLYSLPYDSGLSPPSYAAVMNSDRAAADVITPSTGESYDPNFRFANFSTASPHSPAPHSSEFVVGSSSGVSTTGTPGTPGTPPRGHQTQSVILGARMRTRPPFPAGPRRPSQQHGPLPIAALMNATRERGGSVSSVNSQQPSSLPSGSSGSTTTSTSTGRPPRQPSTLPLPSPQFVTPPPKWKGFTMEAAKWTFTSTQLQGIVSRAIRQSSEASSIRLLQLETLDTEIPEEVGRLQTLRTDTMTRYKTYARRRENLLDTLIGGVDAQDPDIAFRQLQELKDISGVLDKATQDLHSLDEQLAQLAQLTQAHSTSALAMALRKLNGSFLKQFAEAQHLRQQVETLQAERDEAWEQAVEVANDYDHLRTGRIESPDTENRFDRVMAVRKLSTRAAKAGLRSAGSTRSNNRMSAGSSVKGPNPTPSSARRTSVDDTPPPVPPIPRRRPVDIKTNLPIRNSFVTGASTELSTPNSETRAMVRAQEELYEMLGIPTNDRSRRSRSVIGLPGDSEPQVISPSYASYDAPPNTGRRASLPPSARLQPPDPYYALTANASIIWTSDRSGWI